MNNIRFNLIALGIAGLTLSGCTDSFLDTSSKTDMNSTSFYQNETQAEYAVVGCYDMYQRTVANGSWPTLFQAVETMSDDCLGGGGPDDRSDRLLDRFNMDYKSDAVSLFDGIWADYYKAIYNCNLLIGSLDKISWSSSSARNVVESEARALRGLAYFDLVRMFENVPLLTSPSKEIIAQAIPDSVYSLIVSDLKFAADNMPATQYKDKSTNLGRITKYAAGAMLARVYLFYDGVYNNNAGGTMPGKLTKAQALKYCEDAISSGNYALESQFSDLWPAASAKAVAKGEDVDPDYKEVSNEIVWVVKFNNDQNWTNGYVDGNRFIVNLGMRNVTAYAPYGNGWGACPITPYAESLFGTGDTRGTATIINCSDIGAYNAQIQTDCMDYTGFVNKKYCPLIYSDGSSVPVNLTDVTGGNMQTSQDQDWILMRYSDVLLMAAELGSSNAMKYFNQVRERAYGNTTHDLNAAPTIAQIWEERRKEFMGEGIRYFDLRRQGLDAFVAAQLGQATDNGTSTGAAISVYNNRTKETIANTYVEANIRIKRGFWQIPYNQITLSGNVYKQNAGW
jgi:starch-binding outer membrane protein, SusD/RagB family